MKYETPELTALMPAINAIQSTGGGKRHNAPVLESSNPTALNEAFSAYADWE